MKDIYVKLIIAIITLIGGTLLGVWVKTWQDKKENQMRYLDFSYEIRNNIIGRPEGLDKKIEVLLDGQKINNLAQVDISIYNGTDKGYSDLPIYIEIYPKNDSLKLIRADISGQEDSNDFIELIQDVIPSEHKGALKFGYKIRTVNRIGNEPVFTASYLVIGKLKNFQINVIKQGLDLREYDYLHFYNPTIWERDISWIIIFIVVYAMFIFWAIRHSAKRERKNNSKLKTYFKDKLADKIKDNKLTIDSEKLSDEIIKIKNRFDWENTRKWVRFIEGRKEPE